MRINEWANLFLYVFHTNLTKHIIKAIMMTNLTNQPYNLTGFPIVALICNVLIFCHPFFNKETKKLTDILIFCLNSSSVIANVPTAVPIQRTFFNWNLTVDLISFTFSSTFSFSPRASGNLLILFKIFPNNFGICFINESLANKVWNGLAHFFTNFLSLLNFFNPSTSMQSILAFWACSQWAAVPIIAIFFFGAGTFGNLIAPVNLLSLSGS